MRRYGIHCRCKLKSRRDDTFGQSWTSRHGWRNGAPAAAVSLSPCRPEGFVLGGTGTTSTQGLSDTLRLRYLEVGGALEAGDFVSRSDWLILYFISLPEYRPKVHRIVFTLAPLWIINNMVMVLLLLPFRSLGEQNRISFLCSTNKQGHSCALR